MTHFAERRTCIVLWLLLLAGPARAEAPQAPAQEPPPAGELSIDEQVDRHVQAASESFAAGRYDDSVRELRAAYGLDPQPIFMFNIAQSLRRGQRLREALAHYQRFLQADPRHSLRAETLGYVRELSALIQKQEELERERRRPVWKRAWFWATLASSAAAVGAGLGLGLGLGLRDETPLLERR